MKSNLVYADFPNHLEITKKQFMRKFSFENNKIKETNENLNYLMSLSTFQYNLINITLSQYKIVLDLTFGLNPFLFGLKSYFQTQRENKYLIAANDEKYSRLELVLNSN